MKKIIISAMAGLFLVTSLGWAQETTPTGKPNRVHTRPPYAGPTKAVKKADYKHAHLPAKPKGVIHQATAQAPAGQNVNH